eukprot:TRINITY_DN1805_c0_g1_i1.p1 TRINITY_DN1805_c0_g1~~TRINITY_DN1805_c0_g1_i1.p1  ORF type:complete len:342 (-),score=101.37 TRINITY_DN1805_c0_g1_i1:175-1200(-)
MSDFENISLPLNLSIIVCNYSTGGDECVNGDCLPIGLCNCDLYWTGPLCDIRYCDDLGTVFDVYRWLFVSLFYCLAAVAITFLLINIFVSKKDRSIKISGTVTLALLFFIAFALLRAISFTIDAHTCEGIFPLVVWEILYSLPNCFLFSAFLLILVFWAHLTHGSLRIKREQTLPSKAMIIIYAVINAIYYAVEICLRVALNSSDDENIRDPLIIVHAGFFATITILFTGGFVIYGAAMYKISAMGAVMAGGKSKAREQKMQRMTELCFGIGLLYTLFFFLTLLELVDERNPENFLLISGYLRVVEITQGLLLLWIFRPRVKGFSKYISGMTTSISNSNNT